MTEKTVKTPDGRTLTYRERGPGDVLALLEFGPDAPSTAWLEYALMVSSVEAIDAVPVIRPQTRVQLEQLANQIGNDGIEALSTALFGPDAQATPPKPQKTEPAPRADRGGGIGRARGAVGCGHVHAARAAHGFSCRLRGACRRSL